METAGSAAQKRIDTMEIMRTNLMTANAHAIAGDYFGSYVAWLTVKAALDVVKAMDEGDGDE